METWKIFLATISLAASFDFIRAQRIGNAWGSLRSNDYLARNLVFLTILENITGASCLEKGNQLIEGEFSQNLGAFSK